MDAMEKISQAELEVLKVLWEANGALSSAEINDALKIRMGWEKSTIRTLVHRLTEKGALIQEKREMFYYTPVFSEKAYVATQTKNFVAKMYQGNVRKFVASLFEENYMQPEDLEALKQYWKEGDV